MCRAAHRRPIDPAVSISRHVIDLARRARRFAGNIEQLAANINRDIGVIARDLSGTPRRSGRAKEANLSKSHLSNSQE
jgi:hypothetical protein